MRAALITFLLPALFGGSVFARLPDTTITYARVDSMDLKLDLYLAPQSTEDAQEVRPRPLIVWIHGGGWRGGSRADASPAFDWVDSGYTVASVDYRLSNQAKWPAQIHDVKAAVRWLRANSATYAIDTSHVVAWGASAGGHLAMMLGVTLRADGLDGLVGGNLDAGTQVQGVIDYYGASNFLEYIPRRWTSYSSVGELLGCAVPKCFDRAHAASPIEYVSAGDAPFLIVHGTADTTVPVSQSIQLEAALRAAQVPVEFKTVDAGHGGAAFQADDTRALVGRFLNGILNARPVEAPKAAEVAASESVLPVGP